MDPLFECRANQFDDSAIDRRPDGEVAEVKLASSFLGRLQRAAQAEEMICLASSWDNWQASYLFECRHGHRFMRSASFVGQHRISCPGCRDAQRLAKLKHVAQAKGGRCLEIAWQGGSVRHRFQ